MLFVQKRMQLVGAQAAFNRTLLFSETDVLMEILPYLKKSLNLVEAEVVPVRDALSKTGEPGYTQMIIESSEPGNPAFEFRNV
jgi:leucyl-tRNA synthetase